MSSTGAHRAETHVCPPAATTNSAVSSSSAGERAFPGHGEPAGQQKNTLGHYPSVGGCLDPAARAIRGPSSSDRSIALGCPSRNDPIRTFRPDDRDRIDPKTRLTLTAPPTSHDFHSQPRHLRRAHAEWSLWPDPAVVVVREGYQTGHAPVPLQPVGEEVPRRFRGGEYASNAPDARAHPPSCRSIFLG